MKYTDKIASLYGQEDVAEMLKRFWSLVDKCPTHWWWLGSRDWDGYGIFSYRAIGIKAHRFSWELANDREFPLNLVARHMCWWRFCINPVHIIPGTHAENSRDTVEQCRTAWHDRERRRNRVLMRKAEMAELQQVSQ